MTRPVTTVDELIERHPWIGYVVIALMALLCSIEVR